ncbi:insulinase family protein [Sphingopyxis sp.]|uniref:insulinase family protein n=1 Tax=Sphingopyxis sp. TaxID=1908224 RepID=UPI0025E52479|nr:insulinase family protein [Sphingopyxis sp.]
MIKTAPATRLRDLYDLYYRPERATLVMVGDFDPAAVEAKIKARFGDWKGAVPPAPILTSARSIISAPRRRRFHRSRDPGSVTLAAFKPWVDEADTKGEARRSLAEDVGEAIVSRRLAKLALNEDRRSWAVISGEAAGWKVFDQVTVGAVTKGAWRSAGADRAGAAPRYRAASLSRSCRATGDAAYCAAPMRLPG